MNDLLHRYEAKTDRLLAAGEARVDGASGWLRSFREAALRVAREHGVPTPKQEEWKYTPLRTFSETDWDIAGAGSPTEIPFFASDSIKIALVNGRFATEDVTATGVSVTSFDSAASNGLLEEWLGQSKGQTSHPEGREITPDTYPFGELNSALFENGVVVHVTGVCDQVIEIVHVSAQESGTLCAPRILVIAGKNSQAKIVEHYVSANDAACAVVPVTEVFVQEGANIEHVRAQDQSLKSTHIGVWQTRQRADSTYTAFNVCYGGSLGRLDQTIWIEGENCTTRLDGVVCANGEQHIDNHTRLDHAVPNCNSFEIYKQIVDGSATVVFNGKIFVHQDAQKTDAKQTNQALLLSPTATIDSKPQLEIFADDVKCTHGATVGQLEDLPMFYMRSRGVSQDEAQAVLVYAFAAEVLEMISIEPVRKALEKRLYGKLGVNLSE